MMMKMTIVICYIYFYLFQRMTPKTVHKKLLENQSYKEFCSSVLIVVGGNPFVSLIHAPNLLFYNLIQT